MTNFGEKYIKRQLQFKTVFVFFEDFINQLFDVFVVFFWGVLVFVWCF